MSSRPVTFATVVDAVERLCANSAFNLPPDTLAALQRAEATETSPLGKNILKQCIENAALAAQTQVPLCQDTGTAVFEVTVGSNIHIKDGSLTDAINQGVRNAYTKNYLRKSIVSDPLYHRVNTKDNTPAVIHYDFVEGDSIRIRFAAKGGGAENMSAIRMMVPADGEKGVINFVIDTIQKAGGNPCPPIVVGVGIGGNFEGCAWLAKKALLRPTGEPNPMPEYAALEQRLLQEINQLHIGPQGLGGDVTALAVHIETGPTHIASFPVAVNINCHSARHAEIII